MSRWVGGWGGWVSYLGELVSVVKGHEVNAVVAGVANVLGGLARVRINDVRGIHTQGQHRFDLALGCAVKPMGKRWVGGWVGGRRRMCVLGGLARVGVNDGWVGGRKEARGEKREEWASTDRLSGWVGG